MHENTTERYHRLDLFDDTDDANLCTVFGQISTKGKVLFYIGLLLNISLKVYVCRLWELLLFDITSKLNSPLPYLLFAQVKFPRSSEKIFY